MAKGKTMKKIIILSIITNLFFCKTLNDAQEDEEIKKCKKALLYNLYISQELRNEKLGQVDGLPLFLSYSQCLDTAKQKRGKTEIPL